MLDAALLKKFVGTIWDDQPTMQAAAAAAAVARREEAGRRGVTFGDTNYREVVYIDVR